MTSFYFRHMMGCRRRPSHMLYLGKQARRPSVSNPTRRPDNGHSSYSAIITQLIKKAVSLLCVKEELLQAEWATECRGKAEAGKFGLHQRSRVIKQQPTLTRSGLRLPYIT